MKNLAINIKNESGTVVGALDLYDDIEIKVEYQMSDIREPQSKKISYTHEFKVPGTSNNNKLFMPMFDNGYSVTNFNPNLKLYAQLSNGNIVFEGVLQMTKVTEIEDRYEYTVIIYDTIVDFFADLGDDELRGTLDLSQYNHLLDSATIKQSWYNRIYRNGILTQASNGLGYVYPLEDRVNSIIDNGVPTFFPGDMRPAIFVKTYIDAIFAKFGWKYESKFFNSDYFKKLIIPFSSDKFVPADENTQFGNILTVGKANASFSSKWYTSYAPSGYPMGNPIYNSKSADYQYDSWNLEDMNTIVTDPGNVYNLSTDTFTVAKSGMYEVTTGDQYLIHLHYDGPGLNGKWYVRFADSNGVVNFPYIETKIVNETTGVVLANGISHFDIPTESHYGSTHDLRYYTTAALTWKGNLSLGDKIKVYNRGVLTPGAQGKGGWDYLRNIFWETTNKPADNNGYVQFEYYSSNNELVTYTNADYIDTEVGYGDVVPINNAIPDNFKLKDLFTSLNKLFNLYWEPTTNFKELRIEPYEDFFANNTSINPIQEWTHKVDRKQEYVITPMYELTGNEYLYTYKSDGDWCNAKYELEHKGVFGEKRININTDFIVEQYKVEPIFSATPLVTYDYANEAAPNLATKLFMPSYAKKDEKGTRTKLTPKPRILFWGGLLDAPNWKLGQVQSVSGSKYNYVPNSTIPGYGKAPYAGHLDNPLVPTEDLNYGVAKEFYNDWKTVTNNNLFNKYWRNWLQSIIDVDANMLLCYVNLDALDIANFNLKNTYQVDGVFYRVNKMTYNATTEMAEVELIRQFDYPAFVPAIALFVNSGMVNLPTLPDNPYKPWKERYPVEWNTSYSEVPKYSHDAEPWLSTDWMQDTHPWVGNQFGTWMVGKTESPTYTGTPWIDSSTFKSKFPATTADFIPLYSNRNEFTQGNFYKRTDLINLTGFFNTVSEAIEGPITINGNGNNVMANASSITVLGNGNTVMAGVKNTIVIGDFNVVTLSDATYNNGIVTKGGIQQTRIDVIRGGIDEVQNPFNQVKIANVVRGGIDAVKNMGSATTDEIINGNVHIENKLFNYNRS